MHDKNKEHLLLPLRRRAGADDNLRQQIEDQKNKVKDAMLQALKDSFKNIDSFSELPSF